MDWIMILFWLFMKIYYVIQFNQDLILFFVRGLVRFLVRISFLMLVGLGCFRFFGMVAMLNLGMRGIGFVLFRFLIRICMDSFFIIMTGSFRVLLLTSIFHYLLHLAMVFCFICLTILIMVVLASQDLSLLFILPNWY